MLYKQFAAVFFSLSFAAMMIFFPTVSISAVKDALALWGCVVAPSLLPFFICSNFMLGTGFTEKLSEVSEPLVRRVFHASGSCSFPFIMSLVSGYPVGVKILSDMRVEGRISRQDAEKGLFFCSTSGPLFMIGAVGNGMLGSNMAGWIIAAAHYTGAIVNGIVFGRMLEKNARNRYLKAPESSEKMLNKPVPERRFGAAVEKDRSGLSYNMILARSIMDAVSTLFLIVGYMIIFMMIVYFMKLFSQELNPWLAGILELSVGCRETASYVYYTQLWNCVMCASMISFGGLCVIFQSMSFLSKCDVNLKLFVVSKFTHACFAAMTAFLICRFIYRFEPKILSVFMNVGPGEASLYNNRAGFVYNLLFSGTMVCFLVVVFAAIVIIYGIYAGMRKKRNN